MKIGTCITGIRFRGRETIEAIARMESGSRVLLERDPGNSYDSNAVKCWFLGIHVGFIPKQANPRIAAAMDAGEDVTATVTVAPEFRGRKVDREPSLAVSWDDRL